MKKITKLKDLPTEQRLRIEIRLDRNRTKPPSQKMVQPKNELLDKIRQNDLLDKIRQEISKPKYRKLFNKN